MNMMTFSTARFWLIIAIFVLFATMVPAVQTATAEVSSSPAPVAAQPMASDMEQEDPLPLQGFENLTVGSYFSCLIPIDWRKDDYPFGLSPEEKKIYGVMLFGPGFSEITPRISVYYYAEANVLYESIEQFVELHSKPVFVQMAGDNYGPITEASIANRKAIVFERQKNEFLPMMPGLNEPAEDDDGKVYERMARPVPVIERFVVLPAESGFYALRYYAPAENFQEALNIFEQVTASFRVLQ